MGNQCSGCNFEQCCPWLYQKTPTLPPKTGGQDRPKPTVPDVTEDVDFLVVKEWNLEIERNGNEHRTSDYFAMSKESDNGSLIVRRGQPFFLTLKLNVPYDSNKHKLCLMFFVTDKNPNFGNGTQVGVKVGAEEDVNGWWVKIHSETESSLTLEVNTSAQSPVGQWRLEIDVVTDEEKAHCFKCPQDIFLLFNPWSKDDSVYMEADDERAEFVMSDTGLIWRGTHSRLRPCPWTFGQFDKDVLDCVLYVLSHLCHLLPAHRSDPIKIVRAISAGVNSPDDSGVLVGNWSGKYEGGRSPTAWRDSVSILQQFFDKKNPVKYGQCWVFSGVVTTACRALGIPCRPVTNFSSAHDTHNSLTIDYFSGDEGEPIEELNSDSVWNFHVWNEAWMLRPDLGDDYGGWQVIDSTPQEESDGLYRCGPASLVAIKRGEIHLPYDVPFVYSEVNADTLFWKYQGKRSPMKLLGRKTGGIGINISTKAVGKMRRDDITYMYKHTEASGEERSVMAEALRRCQNAFARYYLNEEFEDVEFQLHLKDDVTIGKPFTVSVSAENKSDKDQDVSVLLRVDTMMYTGVVKDNVTKSEMNINIKPHSKESAEITVTYDNYYKRLVDQCAFNVSCLGRVKRTAFEYFAQDDFRVRKPDIKIKCQSEKVEVGKVSKWTATFDNPLPQPLSKAAFYIIPNHADSVFNKLKKKIESGAAVTTEFELQPRKAGDLIINVIFSSKELEDVDGFATFTVQEAPEEATSVESEDEKDKEEKPAKEDEKSDKMKDEGES